MKFLRSLSPASPLFSGWNWVPKNRPENSEEENITPCSVTEDVSLHNSGAYEWIK